MERARVKGISTVNAILVAWNTFVISVFVLTLGALAAFGAIQVPDASHWPLVLASGVCIALAAYIAWITARKSLGWLQHGTKQRNLIVLVLLVAATVVLFPSMYGFIET